MDLNVPKCQIVCNALFVDFVLFDKKWFHYPMEFFGPFLSTPVQYKDVIT